MKDLILWCRKQSTGLPLTFLLGFYVSLVVRRWWEQYCKLPWPDDIALSLSGVVTAGDNNKVSPSRSHSQQSNHFLPGEARQENCGQVLSGLLHSLSPAGLQQAQQAVPHRPVHRDVRWAQVEGLSLDPHREDRSVGPVRGVSDRGGGEWRYPGVQLVAASQVEYRGPGRGRPGGPHHLRPRLHLPHLQADRVQGRPLRCGNLRPDQGRIN